jgi:hypothetical protein
MAGSFTDWAENAILDHFLGRSTTDLSTGNTKLDNIAFGLWESTGASVGDAMTGETTGECAGSTYSRVNQVNSSNSWANSAAGVKNLKASVEMTTAAGTDWGTVGWITIGTSSGSSGQIIAWTTITGGTKTINSGDTVTITTDYSITLT